MNTRRHIKKLLRKLQRKHLFRKLSRKIFLSHINSLLFLALLAGVATGFLSVLFRKMLKYGEHFVEKVISWLQTNVHDYSVAIVPVAGAIILVILMRIFPFVVESLGKECLLIDLFLFLAILNLKQNKKQNSYKI